MGSSGMKRKGRKHLPKAGTRPSTEQLLHDERANALHPFSSDPWHRRGGIGITAIIVVAVVFIGVIGIIALT
jgi:hypothetical protein